MSSRCFGYLLFLVGWALVARTSVGVVEEEVNALGNTQALSSDPASPQLSQGVVMDGVAEMLRLNPNSEILKDLLILENVNWATVDLLIESDDYRADFRKALSYRASTSRSFPPREMSWTPVTQDMFDAHSYVKQFGSARIVAELRTAIEKSEGKGAMGTWNVNFVDTVREFKTTSEIEATRIVLLAPRLLPNYFGIILTNKFWEEVVLLALSSHELTHSLLDLLRQDELLRLLDVLGDEGDPLRGYLYSLDKWELVQSLLSGFGVINFSESLFYIVKRRGAHPVDDIWKRLSPDQYLSDQYLEQEATDPIPWIAMTEEMRSCRRLLKTASAHAIGSIAAVLHQLSETPALETMRTVKFLEKHANTVLKYLQNDNTQPSSPPHIRQMLFPLVKEHASLAQTLFEEYLELRPSMRFMNECPKRMLFLESIDLPVWMHGGTHFDRGCDSRIFAFGNEYIVKTLATRASESVAWALLNEKALMTVVQRSGATGVSPSIFSIDWKRSVVPEICGLLAYASFMLGKSLDQYSNVRASNMGFVSLVATQGLEALRRVHSTGFVHADIHSGNILLEKRRHNEYVLHLVDFGYASAYMDEYGTHIGPMDRKKAHFHDFNLELLSPWHLQSHDPIAYLPTRRDDVFRFAEALYEISSPTYIGYRQKMRERARLTHVPKHKMAGFWVQFKRDRTPNFRVPEAVRKFYDYALTMGFDHRPEYDHWIRMFQQL